MKRFVQINNKLYRIQNVKDLRINKYQEIINLLNEKNDIIELSKELLNKLTILEKNEIDALSYFDLLMIEWSEIIKIPKKNKLKKRYIIDDITFKPYEYHKLLFSRFIEIEYYLQEEDHLLKVLATIILNDKLKEDILDETMKKIDEYLKVEDAIAIMADFLDWRKKILDDFSFLFKVIENDEDADENEEKSINDDWLKIAYSLTNEDITKVDEIFNKGILEILNWLSYLKEKRDEEKEAQKGLNRIH